MEGTPKQVGPEIPFGIPKRNSTEKSGRIDEIIIRFRALEALGTEGSRSFCQASEIQSLNQRPAQIVTLR